MIHDWPLFELHIRMTRSRKAKRGIRLSPVEFAMLVDETEVLDQLWAKVSEALKRDGYDGGIVKREGPSEREKVTAKRPRNDGVPIIRDPSLSLGKLAQSI